MSLLGRLSYHPIRNHNLFFLASVQVYINHGMGEIHTFPQGNRVPLSVFMNKMFFRYVRFMALHKKLPQINEWHHFSWNSSVDTTSKHIHNWGEKWYSTFRFICVLFSEFWGVDPWSLYWPRAWPVSQVLEAVYYTLMAGPHIFSMLC